MRGLLIIIIIIFFSGIIEINVAFNADAFNNNVETIFNDDAISEQIGDIGNLIKNLDIDLNE